MKRGIPIALQAAGAVLACLVLMVNCDQYTVVTIEKAARARDTVFIFNESGKLIYFDTLARHTNYWVIKTCKTKEEIFYDVWHKDPAGFKDRKNLADVDGISGSLSEGLERRIGRGDIDTFVENNLVILPDKRLLKKIREMIADSGEGIDEDKDSREYGGFIFCDTMFKFKKGAFSEPCSGDTASVRVKPEPGGLGYFHSHPSMQKNSGSCAFTQGPSMGDQAALRKDQEEVMARKDIDSAAKSKKQLNYVFGMRKDSRLLYVLGINGVLATIPFKYFE